MRTAENICYTILTADTERMAFIYYLLKITTEERRFEQISGRKEFGCECTLYSSFICIYTSGAWHKEVHCKMQKKFILIFFKPRRFNSKEEEQEHAIQQLNKFANAKRIQYNSHKRSNTFESPRMKGMRGQPFSNALRATLPIFASKKIAAFHGIINRFIINKIFLE